MPGGRRQLFLPHTLATSHTRPHAPWPSTAAMLRERDRPLLLGRPAATKAVTKAIPTPLPEARLREGRAQQRVTSPPASLFRRHISQRSTRAHAHALTACGCSINGSESSSTSPRDLLALSGARGTSPSSSCAGPFSSSSLGVSTSARRNSNGATESSKSLRVRGVSPAGSISAWYSIAGRGVRTGFSRALERTP